MKFTRILTIAILLLIASACSKQSDPVPEAISGDPVKPIAEVDESGDCVLKPLKTLVMCTADWNPVCGCNDRTYSNACNAKAAGVPRFTPGECDKKETQ